MERSLTFQCETLLNFERICLSPVFTIIRSKLLQKIRSWYLSFAIFCTKDVATRMPSPPLYWDTASKDSTSTESKPSSAFLRCWWWSFKISGHGGEGEGGKREGRREEEEGKEEGREEEESQEPPMGHSWSQIGAGRVDCGPPE